MEHATVCDSWSNVGVTNFGLVLKIGSQNALTYKLNEITTSCQTNMFPKFKRDKRQK